MQRILCATLCALAACSNGKTPEPPPAINPALGAVPVVKCAPLADSILANTPRASITGLHFTTPTVDRCPVWGRADFQQVGTSP